MYSMLNSELEKLTLFKPVVEKVNIIKAERPITPIYDEIKEPAPSLDDLHILLKRRLLVPRTWALSFLSVSEQEELAAILFSEVTKIWPDLQSCGESALLNEEQNKCMLRRMTIYVVTTCEILFDRHIALFQKMLKTEVFEKFANFVRVKRMLSDEAARLLDVLTVRRYIGDDIRAMDSGQIEPEMTEADAQKDEVSFSHLVTMSRPPLDVKYKWTLESDIRVMKARFPNLDLSALRTVLSTLPPLPPIGMIDQLHKKETSTDSKLTKVTERFSTAELLKAAGGMQNDRTIYANIKRTTSASDPLHYYEPEFSNEKNGETFITAPVDLTAEAKKAIMSSTKNTKIVDDWETTTIQPLLKASLYLEGVSRRTTEKECKIAELAKFISDLETKRRVEVKRSPYLQPDYFEVPISKDVVLRASGPRVTERQLEANMSLQSFLPLFDELSFDITETDIAEMDESLFVHRELADVYKEIVAVIPKGYMELSSDKAVKPAASGSNFDIARCIASSRLGRQGSAGGGGGICRLPSSGYLNVIAKDPPWQKEGLKSWIKNGPGKALCTTNRKTLIPQNHPASADIARILSESLPDYMDPKLFLSWHSWWRQFFSSDDFFKYVNRQDTDFLAFIYHLWGAEGDRPDSPLNPNSSAGPSSPISSGTPVHGRREQERVPSTTRQSVAPTPVPMPATGMWMVDSTIREPLDTEANINEKAAKTAQMAKEGARIYSVTGLTQTISIADLATQRIERRRQEEIARRKLSPDEILERELATLTIQERFVRVWDLLRLGDDYRAAQIFKYSGSDTSYLLHIVKLWEGVAHVILKREYTLGQFEQFERIASDPNRYFEKGYLGSSQARFDEEVVRASLSKQLDEHDVKVKAEIAKLANGCGDIAMYRGRPYTEKMLGDRVQVMFWLSEERKAEAIRRHLADKKLNEALFNSMLVGPMALSPAPLFITPRETSLRPATISSQPPSSPILTVGDILAAVNIDQKK